MKQHTISFSLIIAGFIIGVVFMGLLSKQASKVYIEGVRIEYEIEQEVLAVRAQKDGDLNKALVHYSNVVYATSSPGIRFFETRQSTWSLAFPFAAIILQEMRRNVDPSNIVRARIEGMNRGKLAIILKALGRNNEAEEQYQIAANLMGINDTQRVQEMVRHVQEETVQNWFQLENQFKQDVAN